MAAQTLYDKLWAAHLVKERDDGTALIYIDRQLVHEVTSPQAFEGLRLAGRRPWRTGANLATPDHNVPTVTAERSGGVAVRLQTQAPRPPPVHMLPGQAAHVFWRIRHVCYNRVDWQYGPVGRCRRQACRKLSACNFIVLQFKPFACIFVLFLA